MQSPEKMNQVKVTREEPYLHLHHPFVSSLVGCGPPAAINNYTKRSAWNFPSAPGLEFMLRREAAGKKALGDIIKRTPLGLA